MNKDKFYHSVYLVQDRCTGCFTCLKRCPTQAIRIRDRKASIIPEFCIDCGECNKRCPHHAKRSHRPLFDEIKGNYKYTVALPAPSLYAQFNNITDPNIVLTAIKLSGFDDVFEISAAAELVTLATRKYVSEHKEKWPLISTACPTIERLIRVKFPNLIDNLLPILPPSEIAAKMARERAIKKTGLKPEEIGIIFISPCPSKLAFIHAPLGLEKSNIDEGIAVKDIYPVLLSNMKDAEKAPENLSHSGKVGKGWAISGGEAKFLDQDSFLAADGIENVMKVLEDLEDEKFLQKLSFVELNSCSPGCVGGVLNVENAYLAKAKTGHLNRSQPIMGSEAGKHVVQLEDLLFTKEIEYEPVYSLGDNIFESMALLEKVDSIQNRLPGLDCGSCGAPTCRALAEDIVRHPEKNICMEDCIYLVREE